MHSRAVCAGSNPAGGAKIEYASGSRFSAPYGLTWANVRHHPLSLAACAPGAPQRSSALGSAGPGRAPDRIVWTFRASVAQETAEIADGQAD